MPAASPRELKTARIVLKLTPSEKRRIDQRAEELGLDTAALLRTGWRYMPLPKVDAR